MSKGDSILEIRDRAILRFYIFTGARIATGCKLKVNDFQQDGDELTIRFHLKGGRVKTKGINYQAAEAIQEYIEKAELKSGPLFRPRSGSKGEKLAERQMTERTRTGCSCPTWSDFQAPYRRFNFRPARR